MLNDEFFVFVGDGLEFQSFLTYIQGTLNLKCLKQYTTDEALAVKFPDDYIYMAGPRNRVLYEYPNRVFDYITKDNVSFFLQEDVELCDFVVLPVSAGITLKKRYTGNKKIYIVFVKEDLNEQFLTEIKSEGFVRAFTLYLRRKLIYRGINNYIDYSIKDSPGVRKKMDKFLNILHAIRQE